jgi:Ca2+-binding RTX toxin-like protein
LRALDETATTGLELFGNDFDNAIYGTDGADSIAGNDGNDRLFAHDGDDTLRGGDGVDELILDVASTEVSGTLRLVDMVLQTVNGTKFVGQDIEQITFTDQTLTYGEVVELTSSVAITGDLARANVLSGTEQNDTIFGGRGDDTIDGLGGNDRIYGGDDSDNLQGGAGNDILYTGSGANNILAGGTGNDTFYVDAEGTTVTEAANGGTDTIFTSVDIALAGGSEIETINTADSNAIDGLSITGSDSANTIRANAGNNTLDGGGGDDRMFGYGGDDTYIVDNAGDFTYESANGGIDTVMTSVDRTLRSVDDIEILRTQDEASTTGLSLVGNALDNQIFGTAGSDFLRGGGGDDVITSFAGGDTVYGDDGTDVLLLSELSTEVTGRISGTIMNLYTANGTLVLHNSLENIEFLDQTLTYAEVSELISSVVVPGDPFGPNDITGTNANDTLDGLAGNDTLRGLDGNDVLLGGDGVDSLYGGAGDDTLRSGTTDDPLTGGHMDGGTGNDLYYVDAARSTIVEAAGGGDDTVYTTVTVKLAADAEIEELRAYDLNSTNVFNLTGSDTGQTIRGNAGNNAIDGGGGGDTMFGYGGDDIYFIDDAGDVVNEWAGNGFDTVRTKIDFSLGSVQYIERIEVSGTTGLTLQANQLDNGVVGGVGDDWLLGQGGNDTLVGGFGDDTLYGGDGIDRAVFNIASTAVTANRGASSMTLSSAEGDDFVLNDVEVFVFTDTTLTYDEASVLVADVNAVNQIDGTNNGETLTGTSANEIINGFDGWDWIIPGRGNDTVDGGTGRDMVSYSDVGEVAGRGTAFMLDLDLGAGTAKIFGGEVDQLTSIERVTGSIYADVLRGTDGDDELRGIGDYDWFVATTGNDTLNGGNGLDMITFLEWGGTGAAVIEDIFSINGAPPIGSAAGGITLDLSNPGSSTGLAQGLTLISIERVTGSSYQDVFFGDGNENDFRGLGGYDWFVGSTGGRERYFGGDGLDTVTYYQSTAGISASLRNGAGLSGGQETGYGSAGDAVRDLYFEIENLVGTAFDDSLTGNEERNQLSGLDGDDFIFGYSGTDYMKGGAGDDTINGGAGSDFALYDGNLADYSLTRTSATDVVIAGADGTDSLSNVEYFQFDDTTANIWELAIV